MSKQNELKECWGIFDHKNQCWRGHGLALRRRGAKLWSLRGEAHAAIRCGYGCFYTRKEKSIEDICRENGLELIKFNLVAVAAGEGAGE